MLFLWKGYARFAYSGLRDIYFAVGPITYFAFQSEARCFVPFFRVKVKWLHPVNEVCSVITFRQTML